MIPQPPQFLGWLWKLTHVSPHRSSGHTHFLLLHSRLPGHYKTRMLIYDDSSQERVGTTTAAISIRSVDLPLAPNRRNCTYRNLVACSRHCRARRPESWAIALASFLVRAAERIPAWQCFAGNPLIESRHFVAAPFFERPQNPR